MPVEENEISVCVVQEEEKIEIESEPVSEINTYMLLE